MPDVHLKRCVMLFNSYEFFIFFPIVTIVFYVMPKRLRHFWLLVASYYFYMCWSPKYAILIAVSTVITYLSGLGIARVREGGAGRCRCLEALPFASSC